MPLRKTEAVILKSFKQGETSKILTLYTRQFGKLSVIAKGARSSRSRFGGTLEPANYISLLFYEKENRELHFLSQAEIIIAFAKRTESLPRTILSMAACEFVDRLESSGANPQVFNLLLDVLKAIDAGQEDPADCLHAFQVRMLDSLGFRPDLSSCMNCKQSRIGTALFDIVHGRYICQWCRQPTLTGIVVSEQCLANLRSFQSGSGAHLKVLPGSADSQRQIDNLISAYLRYHVEGYRDLKALKLYYRLKETTGQSG